MRRYISVLLFLSCFFIQGQEIVIPENSLLYDLSDSDSLTLYQCHVEDAVSQLTTASGQTVTGKIQKYTITEKFVIKKSASGYSMNYYTTALNVFPNKKFSGLKIRERPYWDFKHIKKTEVSSTDLKVLLALERKGREAIEYDFAITKYTTNQLIFKRKKDFKQLVIDGNYLVSKLIELN